jgi:DNA-binding SARP family transcriptional activator/TolB-like protein
LYTLRLLGGAWIEGPDGALPGRAAQPRRLALLALLASAGGQPVSRDKLIALLWPESSPESARHSLADSVYVLGRELGASPVVAVGNSLRLNTAVVSSDLAGFDQALGSGDLERAIGLYGGPFLEGLNIREAFEFEEWVGHERERLERALCQALERLALEAMAGSRPKEAARWLRSLVEHEPYSGRVVARLMEALAASGDLAGALQQVASHTVRMRQELDADPDPAVLEMERTLRARRTEEAPPMSVTADVEPSLPPGRSAIERAFPIVPGRVRLLGIAGIGIVLLGVIVALLREQSGMGTGQAAAIGAAPGIAVMPFQVADPNLAVWREALVDLLAANLDGVGGLRAISSRTVLAQYHEGVPEGEVPDLATILEIARDAGGSYAVVGSAVTIGRNIRLSADVFELPSDRAIGSARVEGSPDSLYMLVDRLSLEILRAILNEDADRLPNVPNLASVTTASLPALKAYLAGEVLYRKADFENAIAAYQQAVAADSTFALAWLRLAGAEWWILNDLEIVVDIDRALAYSERLSRRDVRFAEATRAFLLGNKSRARELAQWFVHNWYPDDPEFWFLLALTFGDEFNDASRPGDPADGQQALLRAVNLDPTFAPYRRELLYRYFWDADGDRAAEQLAALDRLAQPDDERVKAGRIAYALAWGDSASRARTWAALDTLDPEFLRQIGMFLNNGRFLPITEALFRQSQVGLDTTRICTTCCFPCLSTILVWEGKFQEVIRLVEQSSVRSSGRRWWAYHLHFFGAALPEQLERDLISQPADTVSWFFAGAYAADRGRWPEHDAAVLAFRAEAHEAGRDSIDANAFAGAANALEGYGLWRRGRAREALPLLIAGQRDMIGQCAAVVPNQLVRRWIGLLLMELGKPAEAVPYLQTLWPGSIVRDPFAAHEIGRAYAQLGENRKAVEAYQEALLAWRNADPVLKPRIETAQREIARLTRTD